MDLVFPLPIPPPTSLSINSSGSSQCMRPEHLSHASSLGWWTWCSYILSLEKTHQSFFLLFHPNQNLLLLFAIILCLVAQSCYFAAPWTAVRQASLSVGFYRQEYCNGLPFTMCTFPSYYFKYFIASVYLPILLQLLPELWRELRICSLTFWLKY